MKAEVVQVCRRCGDQAAGSHCVRCRFHTSWECVIDLDRPLRDGRTTIRRPHNRRAEAEIDLRHVLTELGADVEMTAPVITIGEYLADVWLPKVRPTVGDATWRSYHDELHRHVISRIGDEEIRAPWVGSTIRRVFKMLPNEGRLDGRGGLSPRTVRYIWTIVHRAFEDAVAWNFVRVNPAYDARPERPKRRHRRRPAAWKGEHYERFFDRAREHRLAAAWIVVANEGLERGELLGLRWTDVDLDTGTLTVEQVYVTVNGRRDFAFARRHAWRTIELNPATIDALADWRVRQDEERKAARGAWRDHGLVFAQPNGKPIDPDNFSKAFAPLVVAARAPHTTLEDLRIQHAIRLLAAGIDPDEVARRLGHHSGYYTRRACLAYVADAHLPDSHKNEEG